MDILKPELVWVDNRCYRKIPIKGAENTSYVEEDLYPTQNYMNDTQEDDFEESDNLNIFHEHDKFWTTVTVPAPLIGLVKGKKGKTINAIESSTVTTIKFPSFERRERGYEPDGMFHSKSQQSVEVVITGDKRKSVAEAYKRIEGIVISGRWRVCDFTHFLSIPMNNDSIKNGFEQFKKDVLKNCHARGVNEDLFEYPTTLHLTIVMLTLLNDKEKELAKAELNKCKQNILKMLGEKNLLIEVKGVEYMNDEPGEVDVLYGKVQEKDGDNSLQIIANQLADSLIHVHLGKRDYLENSIKLHVTLMKSRGGQEGGRLSFDARPILKKYSDYFFGEMTLKEINISTRFTGNEQRYYTSVATVTL